MRVLHVSLLLAILGSGAGCIIDTVPTPEYNPSPSGGGDGGGDVPMGGGQNSTGPGPLPADSVFYTRDGSGFALLVAGVAGTVPAGAIVEVTNFNTLSSARRAAAIDGSFSLFIDGATGDRLNLRCWASNALLYQDQLTIAGQSTSTLSVVTDPVTLVSSLSAAVCSPAGTVCLTAAPGTAPAGLWVVAANTAGGAADALAAADGSFTADLPGQSGDVVMVFVVPPGSESGGPAYVVTVP